MTRSVVLVTGGIDSTVLLALAMKHGQVVPLTLELPDRPRGERAALARVLRHFRLPQALRVPVPPKAGHTRGSRQRGYVPGRNLYLLATAHLIARSLQADNVLIGTLASDAEDFADATPAYFRALQRVWDAGRESGEGRLRLRAPFHRKQKSEVVALGRRLKVPLEKTWSCYRDGKRPCERCRACRERAKALAS